MQLVRGSSALLTEEGPEDPISTQQHPVGFCPCGGELISRAYFPWRGWAVAAACRACHRLILLQYGPDWTWQMDAPLEEVEAKEGEERPGLAEAAVSSIPREQLQAVFTKAEIRDLLAYEEGRPYVRQNLYRARAKFDRFQRLFGQRIKS